MKQETFIISFSLWLLMVVSPAQADPKHEVTHYLELGQMLEFNANLDAAKRAYEKAASIDPNSVEAHKALARVNETMNSIDQSCDELETVLRLTPTDETVWLELSNLLKREGKAKEAVLKLQSACRAVPQSINLERGLAFMLLEAQEPVQASEQFHLLIKKNPELVDNYLGLAMADFRAGDENLAQDDISKALELNPAEPNAFCILGDLKLLHEKNEEAIGFFEKAIAARPSLSKPYLSLGNLYIKEDQTEKAKDIFEQALHNCPPEADLLIGMAIVEEKSHATDQSISFYERAASLELDPLRKNEIRRHIIDLRRNTRH